MKDYPRLLCEVTRDRRGRVLVRHYIWPARTCLISYNIVKLYFNAMKGPKVGDRFLVAGTPVVVIDDAFDRFSMDVLVTRGHMGRFYITRLRLLRFLLLINARIILTLDVWNLARCDENCTVGWSQVHFVKWAAKLRSRLKREQPEPVYVTCQGCGGTPLGDCAGCHGSGRIKITI